MYVCDVLDIKQIEKNSYIMFCSKIKSYIKLGKFEANFIKNKINGRTIESIEQFDEKEKMLIEKFIELGIIYDNEKEEKRKKIHDIDFSKIKLFRGNPEKLLNKIKFITDKVFSIKAGIVFGIMTLISMILFLKNSNEMANILMQSTKSSALEILGIYVLMILTFIIHELSHGMACNKYGIKVREIGLMLFYFQIAAYCDVSEIYLEKKKSRKILVLMAGVFSQLVINSIVIMTFFLLKNFGIECRFLIVFSVMNLSLIVVNLLPFVKYDGYWILTVLMNIPNLRKKSFEQLLKTFLRKRTDATKKRFLFGFGLISAIFTLCVWYEVIATVKPILNKYFERNIANGIEIIMIVAIGGILINKLKKEIKDVRIVEK